MPPVLLDTNILVYVIDARDSARQEKAINLVVALAKKRQGCLSVQNLAEFVNVAINKLGLLPDETIDLIENWQQMFSIFDLTPKSVLEAARGTRDHQLSYYDAQIWATARLNQIPFVFSEDFQDGQLLEGVRFVNPFVPSFNLDDWG